MTRKQAFRIIAHPHYGVLVNGQLISFMEWSRLERSRKSKRDHMRRVRESARKGGVLT